MPDTLPVLLDARGQPLSVSTNLLEDAFLRVFGANDSTDILTRADLAKRMGSQFGGRIDMFRELGYPEVITFRDYLAHYTRGGVAGKIVDAPAETTWRNRPSISAIGEDGKPNRDDPWTLALEAGLLRLKFYHYAERSDRLAGIGSFSTMVIGSGKAERFDTPLNDDKLQSLDDVVFLAAYSQGSVRIEGFDEDPGSERFGLPTIYRIDTGGTGQASRKRRKATRRVFVHWSRVIHVVDDPLEDDIEGLPRLARVYNNLHDLLKIGGGSAQAFWNMSFGILHADVPHDVRLKPPKDDPTANPLEPLVKQLYETYFGTRRVLGTRSTDLEILGGGNPDPSGAWKLTKALIAAAADMPERILFGSERGELASQLDEREWLGSMSERQETFAEPIVLRPFIDRLIEAGALKAPTQGYEVEWPTLFELDEVQGSQVSRNRGRAARDITEARMMGYPITEAEQRELIDLPAEMAPDAELEEQLDREDADAVEIPEAEAASR